MSTQSEALKARSIEFAVAILRLIDALPRRPGPDVIAHQLAKSATSVGANYRAACTARSKREFVAKLCIVVEEAEESVYWLELLAIAKMVSGESVAAPLAEAKELRAIFAKSLGTARANLSINDQMTR
jgi:four helix bundle protein